MTGRLRRSNFLAILGSSVCILNVHGPVFHMYAVTFSFLSLSCFAPTRGGSVVFFKEVPFSTQDREDWTSTAIFFFFSTLTDHAYKFLVAFLTLVIYHNSCFRCQNQHRNWCRITHLDSAFSVDYICSTPCRDADSSFVAVLARNEMYPKLASVLSVYTEMVLRVLSPAE